MFKYKDDLLTQMCILECSDQVEVNDTVRYWCKNLNFKVDKPRQMLQGYSKPVPDYDLNSTILWLLCIAERKGMTFT